jgi:hypothetical protein
LYSGYIDNGGINKKHRNTVQTVTSLLLVGVEIIETVKRAANTPVVCKSILGCILLRLRKLT